MKLPKTCQSAQCRWGGSGLALGAAYWASPRCHPPNSVWCVFSAAICQKRCTLPCLCEIQSHWKERNYCSNTHRRRFLVCRFYSVHQHSKMVREAQIADDDVNWDPVRFTGIKWLTGVWPDVPLCVWLNSSQNTDLTRFTTSGTVMLFTAETFTALFT